ncbi:hypothetical protein CIB84_013207 [Bambusicola thoracicus]|uniref:Uncharacterized protein n=1 Tax=Bambusicola thoracicus TaxID=9083 RepID=A0A2P4SG18_BAMTH|nr:hypothetical protein CIB84_013207 [Bambusicola thoracicus]
MSFLIMLFKYLYTKSSLFFILFSFPLSIPLSLA